MTNLHIYYETKDAPWGGGNSFLKYFKKHTSLNLTNEKDSNTILISGASKSSITAEKIELAKIKLFKEQGKKIIYRLDSLGQQSAGRTDMDDLQLELAKLADGIIFQSEFCQRCFEEQGCKPKHKTVVLNGTDLEIFKHAPQALNKDNIKVLACSWSPNLRKGFAEMIELSEMKNMQLTFVGQWCKELSMPKTIIVKPPLEHKALAQEYAKSNILLFPARGEACPNTAVEALACGKPLLYRNSGGTPEVVKDLGIQIKSELKLAVEQIIQQYSDLCSKIEKRRSLFDIKEKIKEYEVFIQKINN